MRLDVLIVWWTAGLAVAATSHSLARVAGFLAVVLLYACVRLRRLRPARRTLAWALPFALPLLALHTFANGAFATTHHLVGLPVRLEGLEYGALVSLRLALMAALAAWSMELNPERAVHDAVRWRLPLSLVVMMAMARSSLAAVERRVTAVLEAQQARGVRVHGGPLVRVRALVALVIPVVVGSLVESDARATALRSRGLGTTPLAVVPGARFTSGDALDVVACAVSLALAFLL